jgi:hypothetical protein
MLTNYVRAIYVLIIAFSLSDADQLPCPQQQQQQQVHTPTVCHQNVDTGISSSGDNFEVTDADIKDYRPKMPTELKLDNYDAMILYAEEDTKHVEEFLSESRRLIPKLRNDHQPRMKLYDRIHPELGMPKTRQLDDTLDKCTFKLLFITKNFVEDAWTTFSSHTALNDAIDSKDKNWSVVPIYSDPNRTAPYKVSVATFL